MKLNQRKIIILLSLMMFVIFSSGCYLILFPTIQSIIEKRNIENNKRKNLFSDESWQSLLSSWDPWKPIFSQSHISPDSLVHWASKYSVELRQFQVLSKGNEYRFQIEGSIHSILDFIQEIETLAPLWSFEQFELVKTSRDSYLLKNVCLRATSFNVMAKNQALQESLVKRKLAKIIASQRRDKIMLTNNPFIISKEIPKKANKVHRCHLPSFQIKGAIADRALHLQGFGEKSIYKLGQYIGDYRIIKIESKRVLLNCAQDTLSRYL